MQVLLRNRGLLRSSDLILTVPWQLSKLHNGRLTACRDLAGTAIASLYRWRGLVLAIGRGYPALANYLRGLRPCKS